MTRKRKAKDIEDENGSPNKRVCSEGNDSRNVSIHSLDFEEEVDSILKRSYGYKVKVVNLTM